LTTSDGIDGRRAAAAFREHGAVLARVCMALVGDSAAAERALERVAAEVGAARFEACQEALVRLLAMARLACSEQLSHMPLRASVTVAPDAAEGPARVRAALGLLRPTEREAVVLKVVGGLDTAQVADACGIDLMTARARLARGVSQLVEEERAR